MSLIATAMLVAPAVSATGYLVHVNFFNAPVGFGINPLGGRGDLVDVNIASTQCTDEDDVVDLTVGMPTPQMFGTTATEGADPSNPQNWACQYPPPGSGPCDNPEGTFHDPTLDAFVLTLYYLLLGYQPSAPQGTCSDDGDTVDVTAFGGEGNGGTTTCDPATGKPYGGDAEDGVDVSVSGKEHCDEKDDNDVAVSNYENHDEDDGNDVGVLNWEHEDDNDANDAGVLNAEEGDRFDGNDVGVLNDEYTDHEDRNDVGVANCEYGDREDGIDLGVQNLEFDDDWDDTDASLVNQEINDGANDRNDANVLPLASLNCQVPRPPPPPI